MNKVAQRQRHAQKMKNAENEKVNNKGIVNKKNRPVLADGFLYIFLLILRRTSNACLSLRLSDTSH